MEKGVVTSSSSTRHWSSSSLVTSLSLSSCIRAGTATGGGVPTRASDAGDRGMA